MNKILLAVLTAFLIACQRPVKPGENSPDQAQASEITAEKIKRIGLDFRKNEDEIRLELAKVFDSISPEQMAAWENSGQLEMRIIDGEKRYFKNAVANLYRLDSAAGATRDRVLGSKPDLFNPLLVEKAKIAVQESQEIRWTIQYSLTVPAGIVPEGEEVRCWLPFPKDHSRLTDVQLINVSHKPYQLAEPDALQRSLYITQIQTKEPITFSYSASFSTHSSWLNPTAIENISYDPEDIPEEIRPYTAEEAPHIVFTPRVKELTDSLIQGLDTPYDKVRAIYYWINDHIPWASALEYSTFDCIPDYVLQYRHGDCGMVSFLLLSMARYAGIPVKWQSGWMLHPGFENLHDWTEVWYPDHGWIPLDMSFGLLPSDDRMIKEFYLTGMDAYRLIINDAVAAPFIPEKQFWRSEPFDFQRGEVEWKGGNLYFNEWDYHLEIIDYEEL